MPLVLRPFRRGIRVQDIFFEPSFFELLDQVLFRSALNAAVSTTGVDMVGVWEHVAQYPANTAAGRVRVREQIDMAVSDSFSKCFNSVRIEGAERAMNRNFGRQDAGETALVVFC